jgi:chromosome segregation ATPase
MIIDLTNMKDSMIYSLSKELRKTREENEELKKDNKILNEELVDWKKLQRINQDKIEKIKIELDESYKKNEELNEYINSLEGKLLGSELG